MPTRPSERIYNLSMFGSPRKVQVIGYATVKEHFHLATRIGYSIQSELDNTGLRMAVTSWSDFEIHLAHGNKITLGGWQIQISDQIEPVAPGAGS